MGAAIGLSSSSLFLLSAGVSAIGTISSIRAQQAALQRQNKRIEQERLAAKLKALEEENARTIKFNNDIANNLAFQSVSGYYDDSMSYTNINKQAKKNMLKDIGNIRLAGKSVNVKYDQMILENKFKSEDLTFGGYTSVLAGLTTGYANYKYYKT